jgi:L-alanine-DL-glutamate epimerase-like enolase superfamily enzyme
VTASVSIVRAGAIVLDRPRAVPGDETHVAVIEAGGRCGLYGPIPGVLTPDVLRVVTDALAGHAVNHHQLTHAALRAQLLRHGLDPGIRRWVLGAFDCALWDLDGRIVGCPVSRLLNHDSRRTVPLYASWLGFPLDSPDLAKWTRVLTDKGFLLTKWSVRREGTDESLARTLSTARQVLARTNRPIAFDGNATWDEASAEQLMSACTGREHVRWLEDLLPCPSVGAYRTSAYRWPGAPLGLGEQSHSADTLVDLMHEAWLSALTPDVVWLGGITPSIEVLHHARRQRLPVFLHGRSYLPALHLAAAFPDVVSAVEYRLQWEPGRQELYDTPYVPVGGQVHLGALPGLGTSFSGRLPTRRLEVTGPR